MLLPFLEGNWLVLPGKGRVDLNGCSLADLQEVLAVPDTYYLHAEYVARFVLDDELGEIEFFINMANGELLEFRLELLEEIPFAELRDSVKSPYSYFDYDGETYIIFSLNFFVRLSADNKRVAQLNFCNSAYMGINESEFSHRIRQASKTQTM